MRILLNGEGDPIPIQALPDELPVSDLPILTLVFTESEDFSVLDYASFGYTNFEAVCIGAAGGRGGDASSQFLWTSQTITQTVPSAMWELVRERASLSDYLIQASMYGEPPRVIPGDASGVDPNGPWRDYTVLPVLNKVYRRLKTPLTADASPDGWDGFQVDPDLLRWLDLMTEFGHDYNDPAWLNWTGTYLDLFDAKYATNKKLTFTIWNHPQLSQTPEDIGGGGGGGGLHISAGLLSELPDSVSIVVGTVGPDSPIGQVRQNGPWVPSLADTPIAFYSIPGPSISGLPFIGGSEYNDEKARIAEIEAYLKTQLVSYPGPYPSFPNPQAGSDGGASSFGDICQASGGEGGGPSVTWPGGTKTHSGFGGDGGSGGQLAAGGGGAGSASSGINGVDGTWDGTIGKGGGGGVGGAPAPPKAASHGGRGSYSFADPYVYGDRQPKLGLVPGGGGGAKLKAPLEGRYGSKAISYSPNGVVVVRLSKIE